MGHRTDHAEIDHVVVEMVDNEGIIWAPTFRLSVPPNCEWVVLYSILRNFEFWRLCLSCISYSRFLLSLDDPLPVLCANSTFQRQPNCLQVKPGKNSKLLFRTPHSTVHNFHLIQFLSDIYFAPNDFFISFISTLMMINAFHIFFRPLGRHCFHSGSGIWKQWSGIFLPLKKINIKRKKTHNHLLRCAGFRNISYSRDQIPSSEIFTKYCIDSRSKMWNQVNDVNTTSENKETI